MYLVLTEFDNLMDEFAEAAKISLPPSCSVLAKWKERIICTSQIREALLEEVLKHREAKTLELYLQNIQMILTRLINKCDAIAIALPEIFFDNVDFVSLLHNLQNNLDQIFSYLQFDFSKYFGRDQIIPSCHQRQAAEEFKTQIEKLNSKLNSFGADPSLVEIAFQPLYSFISEEYSISHRTLDYFKGYLKSLELLVHNTKDSFIIQNLVDLLLKSNFNDSLFIQYYTQKILSFNEESETMPEKIDKYVLYLKNINQWHLPSAEALHPDLKSVQWQIQNWLKEEIQYLKVTMAEQVANAALHPVNPMKEDTKINLSISVAVLAVLVKLLLSVGIITNKNQSDVLRFFAAYFRSSKQENIAYKSLHNQFDTPRLGSLNITRDILKKFLQLIDKL